MTPQQKVEKIDELCAHAYVARYDHADAQPCDRRHGRVAFPRQAGPQEEIMIHVTLSAMFAYLVGNYFGYKRGREDRKSHARPAPQMYIVSSEQYAEVESELKRMGFTVTDLMKPLKQLKMIMEEKER